MILHDLPAIVTATTAPTALDDPRDRALSGLHQSLAVRRLMPGIRDTCVVHATFRPDTMALYTALGHDPRDPLVVDTCDPVADRLAA